MHFDSFYLLKFALNLRDENGPRHPARQRIAVIRQAISCDICGRDKQQTNHWFVAYEHGAELRISGWNSQVRMSTKAKHLCGQTCMHKLVDDFMARAIASRTDLANGETLPGGPTLPTTANARTDTSLTNHLAAPTLPLRIAAPVILNFADDFDSSARILPATSYGGPSDATVVPAPGSPTFDPRARRAEAWKREQERERRSGHNAKVARRGSVA